MKPGVLHIVAALSAIFLASTASAQSSGGSKPASTPPPAEPQKVNDSNRRGSTVDDPSLFIPVTPGQTTETTRYEVKDAVVLPPAARQEQTVTPPVVTGQDALHKGF